MISELTDDWRKLVHMLDVSPFKRPRVHGNGFIQLDYSDTHRFHFWGHPDIPRQKIATPIHDHVFGFTSWCLMGRIVNVEYYLAHLANPEKELGRFEVHEARRREGDDTALYPTGEIVKLMGKSTVAACVGETYRIDAGVFHETFVSEPTVTIIEKDKEVYEYKPKVLVPFGDEPDNEFDRHAFPTKLLWKIIREMTNGC